MEVMSYTFYLCLVIIVFSHYVSTESQEIGYSKESGNVFHQNSSVLLLNTVDQKSSSEVTVDQKNSSKDTVEQKSSAEDIVDQKSSSEVTVDQKSSAEDIVDQESSTEEEGDNERTPATFNWQSGIVPFVIGKDYDPIISQRIRSAMHTIESSSCVVFKDLKRKPPKHSAIIWLSIENPEGVRECSHTTMREPGLRTFTKAILVIGYDCMMHRDILHALLHALGFRDEVTHAQRDLYIRVMWENIHPKYRKLFYMRMGEPPHKMVEYDSTSIMHFHDRAFSVDGGTTIMPLVPGLIISPSDTLSLIDVMKLRLAFGHECKRRNVDNLIQTCHNVLINDGEQTDPEDPTDPEGPTNPEGPSDPEGPIDPEGPKEPEGPTDPEGPSDPEGPIDPEGPSDPEGPTDPESFEHQVFVDLE